MRSFKLSYFFLIHVNYVDGKGPATQWSEMCISNFIVASSQPFTTTKRAFLKRDCSDAQKDTINEFQNSDVLLPASSTLDLHAI